MFTCEVDKNGTSITTTGWQIFRQNYGFVPVSENLIRNVVENGDSLTETLMITNVTYNNSGNMYRCRITDDIVSDIVYLIVAGMYIYTSYICKSYYNIDVLTVYLLYMYTLM